MNTYRFPLALFVTLTSAGAAHADVHLPALFSDNMVLQRDAPIPVFGTAAAGESVTVSLGTAKGAATAGADGKWLVKLAALPATDSLELTVSGKNAVTVHNVAIGEVWLCSGQSNMALDVSGSEGSKEMIASSTNPRLRLFKVAMTPADRPQSDVQGQWTPAAPATVARFSAVGYYFGRNLQKELNVPVGLVCSAVGATSAGAWMSREALLEDPAVAKVVTSWDQTLAGYPAAKKQYDEVAMVQWQADADKAKAAGQPEPKKPPLPRGPWMANRPTALFNGMIAPLMPYGIKGVIWYQGENNAGAGRQYRTTFPRLIKDWRERWGQGDFPFLFVQLAAFKKRQEAPSEASEWAEVREAQFMTTAVPHTAMASAIDIGDADNIHPRNKQEVGRRLALAALSTEYGRPGEFAGPAYLSFAVEDSKIRLRFTHADGLQPHGDKLLGFAIAGADKNFVWADATIDGNSVVLSNPMVTAPTAARYSWANNPIGNLYNNAGLPASPFRTDSE